MRRSMWFAVALALGLAAFTGCAWFGGGGQKPTAVDVTIDAADRLNPDESGQSLPTMFRIYLLGSAAKAESAAYEDVYRGVEGALGEEVLAADEIVLSPGETAQKRIAADEPARALVVVGVFRKPSGASWRAVVPLERGKPRKVAFHAEDYRVDRR